MQNNSLADACPLLSCSEDLLVAVSGGVDSMVLLHALHAEAQARGTRLVVAHFNHQLRGAASAADARFVARTARRLGCECVVGCGDVRGLARARGWSIEMAARQLRHAFLARTAKQFGLRTIALAHHADDQVELFFLRLLRGAGGGLAGMKPRSPSPADASLTLVRPLLHVPKADLIEFARARKIRFREDSSNAATDILRNRVRHELLPLLQRRYARGFERAVLRTMEVIGDDAEFVQATARVCLEQRLDAFAALPIAVQRQCVCLELSRLGVAPEFELVERLRLAPDVKHSWQHGWLVRAASGQISSLTENVVPPAPVPLRVELGRRGAAEFAGVVADWRTRRRVAGTASLGAQVERFDAARVGGTITLRHWRAGDRFQPSGLPRSVKLQDLFTNAKIPAAERHRRVVAETTEGEIFWIEGLRIAEGFKLTPATQRELVWRWQRAAQTR